MSDVYRGHLNKQGLEAESNGMGKMLPPNGLPPTVKTLVITFDTVNGNLQVAGPIEDPVLVYGMIGRALDVVRAHNERRQKMSEVKKLE